MHARVGRDRADTLPTHHAQAAGAVPHGVAREPVANGVGDARGGAPRPGIAALAPPAHRRVGALERRQQEWQVLRVVLEVSIEGRDDLSPRGLVARVERGRQPGVRVEAEEAYAEILRHHGADRVGAPVGGAIVHEYDLRRSTEPPEDGVELHPEERNVLHLVEHGDDNRQLERLAHRVDRPTTTIVLSARGADASTRHAESAAGASARHRSAVMMKASCGAVARRARTAASSAISTTRRWR